MRRYALPAALILLVSAATPVFAGAGLPKIATVKAGHYEAAVHNDSEGARVGSNVFTVEIPGLPEGGTASLHLTGPAGQSVVVRLNKVEAAGGGHGSESEGGHGSDSKDSHGTTSKDSHGTASKDSHGTTSKDSHGTASTDSHGAASTDSHGAASTDSHAAGAEAVMMRGKVRLDAEGNWTARLEVVDPSGEKAVGEFPLHVEKGGPNSWFVSISGLLMGGSITYGMIQRRRENRTGR